METSFEKTPAKRTATSSPKYLTAAETFDLMILLGKVKEAKPERISPDPTKHRHVHRNSFQDIMLFAE